ncbi:MAG: cob(I)yrinic acid a,c-diamide adenosyltransferase [Deltaproteobacteria bacterium]
MAYKIYTKKGDKGFTSLFGGKKLLKSEIRIEAYGTVDELNSNLGVVISSTEDKEIETELKQIQSTLFKIGTILATNPEKPELLISFDENETIFLEYRIDSMEKNLEPLRNFILPSGSLLISYTHVARTVCRRAERKITELNSSDIEHIKVLTYINRLSDYLFVLARKFAKDSNIEENIVR